MHVAKPLTLPMILLATLFTAPLTHALEFQPLGNIGMGGAGVARTFDGGAAYWNPGALAFEADKAAIRTGAGIGYQIDDNIASNVDRLSRLEDPTTGNFDIQPNDTAGNRSRMGDLVQLVGVMEDMRQAGNAAFRLNGTTMVGARAGHFGFGVFGMLEGAALPDQDLANIRPDGVNTPAEMATAIGATTSGTPTFFNAQQFAAISAAFGGGSTGDNIAYAFDQQLATSNTTNLSSGSATTALVSLGNSMSAGSTAGTIDTNQSTLHTRGVYYFEVPLAYGYPVSLGSLGTLGIGASVKAMAGRVFISTNKLFTTTSSDLVSNITHDHEDSVTWGVDLGALWKWHALAVGIVAKNLNTPEFSTAELNTTERAFKIKPQVRSGVSYEVFSWLSAAADFDLTRNETAQPEVKSQTLGGGIELRPAGWFSFRAGAYKNVASGRIGPVATAGLTIGASWLNVDLDAAVSPDTGEYKGHQYPREGKAFLSLNSRF